ncbi:hypothetical protein EVAR_102649_1 [Eumeta japonica]|uniref:Uncharacterized protein n=1 Tax=Eumeta variegata TaxID=151549 RepID=A0A4C1TUW6_EUMVA|nr:hypothetical protein EVAR_102649_1 [Eumeta japonica]
MYVLYQLPSKKRTRIRYPENFEQPPKVPKLSAASVGIDLGLYANDFVLYGADQQYRRAVSLIATLFSMPICLTPDFDRCLTFNCKSVLDIESLKPLTFHAGLMRIWGLLSTRHQRGNSVRDRQLKELRRIKNSLVNSAMVRIEPDYF